MHVRKSQALTSTGKRCMQANHGLTVPLLIHTADGGNGQPMKQINDHGKNCRRHSSPAMHPSTAHSCIATVSTSTIQQIGAFDPLQSHSIVVAGRGLRLSEACAWHPWFERWPAVEQHGAQARQLVAAACSRRRSYHYQYRYLLVALAGTYMHHMCRMFLRAQAQHLFLPQVW